MREPNIHDTYIEIYRPYGAHQQVQVTVLFRKFKFGYKNLALRYLWLSKPNIIIDSIEPFDL